MRDIINKINELNTEDAKIDEVMLSEEDAATLADANLGYGKVGSVEVDANMSNADIDDAVRKLMASFWKDGN